MTSEAASPVLSSTHTLSTTTTSSETTSEIRSTSSNALSSKIHSSPSTTRYNDFHPFLFLFLKLCLESCDSFDSSINSKQYHNQIYDFASGIFHDQYPQNHLKLEFCFYNVVSRVHHRRDKLVGNQPPKYYCFVRRFEHYLGYGIPNYRTWEQQHKFPNNRGKYVNVQFDQHKNKQHDYDGKEFLYRNTSPQSRINIAGNTYKRKLYTIGVAPDELNTAPFAVIPLNMDSDQISNALMALCHDPPTNPPTTKVPTTSAETSETEQRTTTTGPWSTSMISTVITTTSTASSSESSPGSSSSSGSTTTSFSPSSRGSTIGSSTSWASKTSSSLSSTQARSTSMSSTTDGRMTSSINPDVTTVPSTASASTPSTSEITPAESSKSPETSIAPSSTTPEEASSSTTFESGTYETTTSSVAIGQDIIMQATMTNLFIQAPGNYLDMQIAFWSAVEALTAWQELDTFIVLFTGSTQAEVDLAGEKYYRRMDTIGVSSEDQRLNTSRFAVPDAFFDVWAKFKHISDRIYIVSFAHDDDYGSYGIGEHELGLSFCFDVECRYFNNGIYIVHSQHYHGYGFDVI
ncbi:unnamed protein product, partial [Mesorhabditis spiculigera]